MAKKLREAPEELEFADDAGEETYPPEEVTLDREVVSTPYDAPVRTLLEEIKEKTLIVNPPFQRQGVWDLRRKSRLIESLLLNIPIPVLYFAEDDDGTRVVVDGQQRLRAVEEFHAGQYRLRHLEVLADLNGHRWTDLSPKQARTVLSRTLRCVVISARSSPTLRFEMFERLNTGGMPLNDQELRNCVFGGALNDLLNELVTSRHWLEITGRDQPDPRLRHHELVLRFFALANVLTNYRPPLKRVLNEFMRLNRNPSTDRLQSHREQFYRAIANVRAVFRGRAFRRYRNAPDTEGGIWDSALNRAVFDIQMLTLSHLDTEQVVEKAKDIRTMFKRLSTANPEFADALSRATADRTRFYLRLRIWSEALDGIGLRVPYTDELPTT